MSTAKTLGLVAAGLIAGGLLAYGLHRMAEAEALAVEVDQAEPVAVEPVAVEPVAVEPVAVEQLAAPAGLAVRVGRYGLVVGALVVATVRAWLAAAWRLALVLAEPRPVPVWLPPVVVACRPRVDRRAVAMRRALPVRGPDVGRPRLAIVSCVRVAIE